MLSKYKTTLNIYKRWKCLKVTKLTSYYSPLAKYYTNGGNTERWWILSSRLLQINDAEICLPKLLAKYSAIAASLVALLGRGMKGAEGGGLRKENQWTFPAWSIPIDWGVSKTNRIGPGHFQRHFIKFPMENVFAVHVF